SPAMARAKSVAWATTRGFLSQVAARVLKLWGSVILSSCRLHCRRQGGCVTVFSPVARLSGPQRRRSAGEGDDVEFLGADRLAEGFANGIGDGVVKGEGDDGVGAFFEAA